MTHAIPSPAPGVFRVGDCMVDWPGGRILRRGKVTHVEPRAMDVLAELAGHAGRTASRDDLITAVWGHSHISDESLSRCVSLVRRALGDRPPKPRLIETVPKRGYRLVAAVSGLPAPSTAASADIAVLPFVNLSGIPDQECIADSLTDLLIAHLSVESLHDGATDTQLLSRSYTREATGDAVLRHDELAAAMARDIVDCMRGQPLSRPCS